MIEWHAHIDGYCERVGPAFWAEPVNAVTNLAFVLMALWMWRRSEAPITRSLCLILGAIGVGSGLFHTLATVWALIADVTPIALYIMVYIYAANRYFFALSIWPAIGGSALFLPYAAGLGWVFGQMPFFAISAGYWPVALLIALYGIALWRRAPATARGLCLGAAMLTTSLIARSVDEGLCTVIPFGTHFLWHILNAAMLGWMIHVLQRHLAGGGGER